MSLGLGVGVEVDDGFLPPFRDSCLLWALVVAGLLRKQTFIFQTVEDSLFSLVNKQGKYPSITHTPSQAYSERRLHLVGETTFRVASRLKQMCDSSWQAPALDGESCSFWWGNFCEGKRRSCSWVRSRGPDSCRPGRTLDGHKRRTRSSMLVKVADYVFEAKGSLRWNFSRTMACSITFKKRRERDVKRIRRLKGWEGLSRGGWTILKKRWESLEGGGCMKLNRP